MALHIIFETMSTINMFSYYSKKYRSINYFLGVISIILSLPLFYNFGDDFVYHSGKISPLKFLLPLLYFATGIIDLNIAGKRFDG
jgi:hypothetical protein